MVKTQLVDPLGRNIGGVPTPTITNTVVTNPIQGTQPAPAPTPVPAVPPISATPVAPVKPVTPAPVTPEPEYQLPENVTGVKPYVSPTLQAKIDAKKPPVTPVVPEPAPVTTEEVKTPVVEPVKPVETKPVEVAPVLTDAEKQAQATGVKYSMVNGLPEYAPTNKEEALKILQSGGKFSAENGMTAVAKANLDKYRKYAQMTDTQLAQNIVNGNVSSRELEQITSINPDLVAKAKDMARKSTITDTANTIQVANDSIVKGEDTQVQNKALTNLLTKLGELDANAESYGDIKARVYANYPDMEVARGEIVNAQTQLRQLQRAKRDIFEDYKKQNSSLPISMIMAGYSALSKGIDDQIYEVNDTLSQNVALYNSYLDEAKSEIDWEVGNQAKQEQRLFDMYGVTNAAEIRQEDFERADKKLADEIARTDKKDAQTLARLEQDKVDNVKEAIAKLGGTPKGETYDELLGEYANAVKNQPSEVKTGLKAGDYYIQDGKIKQVPSQVGGGVQPSGSLSNVVAGNKQVQVDSIAAPGLQNAFDAMKSAGINFVTGAGARDQAATIKAMGDRVGMPGATAAQLRAAGHQIADVGSSQHEPGLAIDLYSDSKFSAPTQKQIDLMAANGWYHPNIPGDAGHFEYRGIQEEPLSDKQYTQYNQAFSKFTQEPVVKAFEGAVGSSGDLISSLNSKNGPGDVGAVFQFMKTLDPASTVREGEFALAAKSAGVWEQFKNIPANKLEGTILTDEQRKAFGKLALEYVKNKAKAYDVKYNDLTRILGNQKIPASFYPTRMSDFVNQYANQAETAQTGKKNIFSSPSSTGGEASVDSNSIW